MKPYLSFVTLGVSNMVNARAFYEAMGFVAGKSSQEKVTFFQLNGCVLGLYGRQSLAEDAGLPADTQFRSVLAHNCPDRDQVDQILAQAAAAGATITQPAAEVFWGGYRGYFQDPEGHLWEVCHNPFVTWTDGGNIWMDK